MHRVLVQLLPISSLRSSSLGRPVRAASPLVRLAMLLALPLSSLGTGCIVRVYQPMSGLHRPVVVDPQLPNFEDVSLAVHCVPEDLLNGQQASALCQKVGTLFENQGAEVTTVISANRDPDDFDDEDDDGDSEDDETAAPPTDLTLELRARELHAANNTLSWAICLATFTLVPAITESTFSQEVVIRDGNGFLLSSESLQGRLVRRFGVGSWLSNALLNTTVRDKTQRLTGETAERELSTDLYRQLSQSVFNAKMQWQVLQEAGADGRAAQEATSWR